MMEVLSGFGWVMRSSDLEVLKAHEVELLYVISPLVPAELIFDAFCRVVQDRLCMITIG